VRSLPAGVIPLWEVSRLVVVRLVAVSTPDQVRLPEAKAVSCDRLRPALPEPVRVLVVTAVLVLDWEVVKLPSASRLRL